MKLDDQVCYCFHVSKRKIVNHLRVHRPRRPSQLSECGGAGTGCGWCVPYLKKCFNDFAAGQAEQEDNVSVEEYVAGREQHLQDRKK